MNSREAIQLNLDMAKMVCMSYLEDLTDEEMLKRPCDGGNHINWQVGHIVASEHELMEKVAPGEMPTLPDGFAARYTKETATVDDPSALCSKAELLEAAAQQREGTLKIISHLSNDDMGKETGVDYAPTVGAMCSMQGSHWMMHAGQWAIVRRQLGRPPLF